MSVDGGREKAAQVCVTCKARKKKCDKMMPRCGYCVRKNLRCSFLPISRRERDRPHGSDPSSSDLFFSRLFHEPAAADANLYRRVLQMIHETGHFIDDLTVRYFQGLHNYLPIVSRTRFQNNLITTGAVPSAGFSLLLLAICLTASASKPRLKADGIAPAHGRDRALYLATKALLSRVQSSNTPCISLIQSRLLLAFYEYTHSRPEDAFDSIAGCARMAYSARIHLNCRSVEMHTDPDALMAAEARNTWWGIILCERAFFCEVGYQDQPLISTIPSDAILPSGTGIQGPDGSPVPYSSMYATNPGSNTSGFDRSAQAVWLLDRVLKSFDISNLDSRLVELQSLDISIQAFLADTMRECYSQEITGEYCQAIAITIRTLLKLHSHILEKLANEAGSQDPMVQNRYQKSQAALDTVAQMVLDIIEIHHSPPPDIIPPSFFYMTRAALSYIRGQKDWEADNRLQSVEERLRASLH